MSLRVLVDGVALTDAEGRALWKRFSAWMEEHKGDLGGFARAEGFASVHPELHGGEPVLIASRTTAQQAYAPAPSKRAHEPARTRPKAEAKRRRR